MKKHARRLTPAQRRVLRTLHEQSVTRWFGPPMRWPHDWDIVRKLWKRGYAMRLHVVRGAGSSILSGLTPKAYVALGIPDPWQRGEFRSYPTHDTQVVELRQEQP